jgi:protoporphyrinogen IX oxidase
MLWLKTLHIVFVVTWYAVLFMLPRLMVYHRETPELSEKFTHWSRRTYLLGHVAFGFMLIFGLLYFTLAVPFYLKAPWMHAKLTLVAVQFAYFIYCGRLMRDLAAGRCTKSSRWLRLFNEVPALLLIAITALVVMQPGGVAL